MIMAHFRFWLRLSKKSPGSEFLKQCFNVGGIVESILRYAQLTGTKVAKYLTAPTSSTASANNGLPSHVACKSALPRTADIPTGMSAFSLI